MAEDGPMETMRGHLLVANGSLYGPVFRQTVILMAEHNDEGALGFVLNQPTSMIVDVDSPVSGVPLADERVFAGGPVQQNAVTIVAEYDDPERAGHIVFDNIGFPSFESDVALAGIIRAKVFAGYSGWGPGQLEGETDEGSWLIEPASVDVVFDVAPEEVWGHVLRRKGGRFALMATMPYDPTIN